MAVLLMGQVLMLGLFARQIQHRRLQRLRWSDTPPGGWPAVEVVLCLRGADASLLQVLDALAGQGYQGWWRLHVVVDSPVDRAWPLLQQWQSGALPVQIHTLAARPRRGSLKCASLLQACQNLADDTAVLAIIDADAVVRHTWLEDLVRACLQPGVGAVSGNRWYQPEQGSFGGSIRAVWNAGVVMAMTLWAIPWGGSLALRRQVVEAGAWKELLQRGLCEDTGLIRPLRQLGLCFEFRPELLVIDRHDGIGLKDLSRWIKRQLLTVRLHHPAWPLGLLYGLVTVLVPLVAVLKGAWWWWLIYQVSFLSVLLGVQAIVLEQPMRFELAWFWALLPAQLINAWAALAAGLARSVEWRGVHYAVDVNPPGVRLLREEASAALESC